MHTCRHGFSKEECGSDRSVTPTLSPGFSLVEVMIALGVVVFALVALCGLLSSGLKVARQAKTELFAAQIASSILAERRAAPLAAMSAVNALPPLSNSTAGLQNVRLDRSGKVAAGAGDAYYSLLYEIIPSDEGIARVFVALIHPPQTAGNYTAIPKAEEHYETTTYIRYK